MRQANRKTKFLTIHLARELHGRIVKMARAAGMPIGQFAAQVLLEAANAQAAAAARRCVHGAAVDRCEACATGVE